VSCALLLNFSSGSQYFDDNVSGRRAALGFQSIPLSSGKRPNHQQNNKRPPRKKGFWPWSKAPKPTPTSTPTVEVGKKKKQKRTGIDRRELMSRGMKGKARTTGPLTTALPETGFGAVKC